MKRYGSILLLSLVVACGGGGGGDGGGLGGPAAIPLTGQQVMESCVTPELLDLTNLMATLDAVAAGDLGALESVAWISGIDMTNLTLSFAIDMDVDGTADVTGSMGFVDAAGAPIFPFDFATLLGSGLDPWALLAGIPDGTELVMDWTMVNPAEGGGTARYGFEGGLLTRISAEGSLAQGTCSFDYSFSADNFYDYPTSYPVADLSFDLVTGTDEVHGTLVLDGTNTGTATLQNGANPVENYTINLDTGEVVGG